MCWMNQNERFCISQRFENDICVAGERGEDWWCIETNDAMVMVKD